MIRSLLFDFSRTLLFPVDNEYSGSLNELYKLKKNEENFNFSNYFALNSELINILKTIKDRYKLAIFTSDSIQKDPAIYSKLNSIFTKIYSAKEIGILKNDPKAYEAIAKDLDMTPDEIVFIDDSKENADVASKAKLNTIVYENIDRLIEEFKLRNIIK